MTLHDTKYIREFIQQENASFLYRAHTDSPILCSQTPQITLTQNPIQYEEITSCIRENIVPQVTENYRTNLTDIELYSYPTHSKCNPQSTEFHSTISAEITIDVSDKPQLKEVIYDHTLPLLTNTLIDAPEPDNIKAIELAPFSRFGDDTFVKISTYKNTSIIKLTSTEADKQHIQNTLESLIDKLNILIHPSEKYTHITKLHLYNTSNDLDIQLALNVHTDYTTNTQ